MRARYRQQRFVLDEPFVSPVPRIYVKNVEASDLASRDANERAWIISPQLLYPVAITSGVFVSVRRCRSFISVAGKTRQSLRNKC